MKRLKIVFCTFLVLFICGCVYVPDVPGYFQEQLADVDEENKELDYLDCNLKYERCEIIQEEYGDKNLYVYFKFTNNSDENATFDYTFDIKSFQNGIELDSNYVYDCEEEENGSKEIQPGTTITVAEVFELGDSTENVMLEIRPFVLSDKALMDLQIELQ